MMDNSGMDSDHSSHASSGSPAIAIKPPPSPINNNNNHHHHHHHHHLSQVHSPRQASPLGPPMSLGHPLSPPPVSTANLVRSMGLGHLPPPGLGLLNSLGVLHNPLDLMAHHGPPRSYNSPPPISTSDPTANECKLVDYRGQKVAAFIIAGDTMLCLPQAFELFLKHLVGGLHTVYTKLKRLDIVPLVCNVEQVRILRGLGAIQPGVNRCKLLSCKDFDTLYRDCTTARARILAIDHSRPGRPPKRAPVGLSLAASHLQHQQIKKHRLDNGDYPYENGHIDLSRLEKSPLLANGYNHPPHLGHMQFMAMPHPAAAHSGLISPTIPHNLGRHDGIVIKNQTMPSMEAIARSGIWENCRAAYEDIVKHLERLREERGDPERERPMFHDQKARDLSPRPASPTDHSPVLNLSKSGGGSAGSLGDNDHSGSEADCPDVPPSPRSRSISPRSPRPRSPVEEDEEENITEPEEEDEKDQDLDDGDLPMSTAPAIERIESQQAAALNYSSLASAVANANGLPSAPIGIGGDASISSTETLLRNIQGLLKVAADNARQQERQINYEKAELKMDVLREREVKGSLERQLVDEQKLRVLVQKRLRRERRARTLLQQKIDIENKRRIQLEEALMNAGHNEQLRLITETFANELEQLKISNNNNLLHTQQRERPASASEQLNRHNSRESGERDQRHQKEVQHRSADNSPTNFSTSGLQQLQLHHQQQQLQQHQQHSNPREREQREVREREQHNSSGGGVGGASGNDAKGWGYSGIDLINSGAAFWQNYSESLAQELELERKTRQQQVDRDVKSPLQERSAYYKNSVLFTST